jgi:arginase family enzyme
MKIIVSSSNDEIIEMLKHIPANESGRKINFVSEKVEDVYEKVKKEQSCIIIGAEHSASFWPIKAFAEKHKNPGLLLFDAHPDCYEYNTNPPKADYVKKLIDQGILKSKNVVMAGIRNSTTEESAYLKDANIKVFDMKSIFNNIENSCDAIMESVRDFDALYISIDIDVLDPAFAPGTDVIEPGGLSARELIYFIQRLKNLKNLRIVDICEINSNKDVNNMTSKLAAKIISELL